MANDFDSDSGNWRTLKIWCWIIGIIAIAVLAVIIFVKVVWWLVWIGAATVVALLIWLWYIVWKTGRRIKKREEGD